MAYGRANHSQNHKSVDGLSGLPNVWIERIASVTSETARRFLSHRQARLAGATGHENRLREPGLDS
jgi:hypothetical protein